MWILIVLLAIIFLFRRLILQHPRNTFGLIFGGLACYVMLKVFMADPGWSTLPYRPWILGIMLIAVVVWASGIAREIFERIWPPKNKRKGDGDV